MEDSSMKMGLSLSNLVERSNALQQVRKTDLHTGDYVYVKTLNSVYVLQVIERGVCVVSGGWFDRKGLSPVQLTVAGCTWGGSAIKVDIVAACGLCIEFGNRLRTSAIQEIFVLPNAVKN